MTLRFDRYGVRNAVFFIRGVGNCGHMAHRIGGSFFYNACAATRR